jgi:predicted TIM-barrel fold metal-dependent hydrolase
MIIDCEVHIGQFKGDPYTWLEGPVDAAQLLRIMDQYGIDRAIVMAPTEQFPKNQALAASIRSQPRLLSFAVVNPFGDENGVRELRTAITEWGMNGLKLMPLRHGYEIDGDAALPLMAAAAELGVAVSIHSGAAQFCLPWQIARLARRFPTVPVIMDHMGWRYYVDGAIDVALEQPNIYLETALVGMPGYIRMAVDKLGPERVIYGSDYPTGHPSSMMANIDAANLKPADKALVLGGNLARILGLAS